MTITQPITATTQNPEVVRDINYVHEKANRLVAVETEISDLEKQIEALKEERSNLRMRLLPEAMFELQLTNIGIGNVQVELEPIIQASLPVDPEKRQAAMNWIVDNRLGGNIKRILQAPLPKGDEVLAQQAIDSLRSIGLKAIADETIHHMTYLSMCRKLVQSGTPNVPLDVLNIYTATIARVTTK
jgi:hypothetical protein